MNNRNFLFPKTFIYFLLGLNLPLLIGAVILSSKSLLLLSFFNVVLLVFSLQARKKADGMAKEEEKGR